MHSFRCIMALPCLPAKHVERAFRALVNKWADESTAVSYHWWHAWMTWATSKLWPASCWSASQSSVHTNNVVECWQWHNWINSKMHNGTVWGGNVHRRPSGPHKRRSLTALPTAYIQKRTGPPAWLLAEIRVDLVRYHSHSYCGNVHTAWRRRRDINQTYWSTSVICSELNLQELSHSSTVFVCLLF